VVGQTALCGRNARAGSAQADGARQRGQQGCRNDSPRGLFGGALVRRYYDPSTGQFLSVDPAASMTGTPYAFTGGDPVNGNDPSGLCVDVNNQYTPGRCGTAQVAALDRAATQARAAGVATGCSNIVSCAVQADAGFVAQHASTLSTIASGLATVAYATCAFSGGIGCGAGLALSAASTALSGINAYRSCFGGAGDCTTAAIGFGISVVATGAGAFLQGAASSALNAANAYARDIYEARQAGVIGASTNGVSFLFGLASSVFGGCGNS